MKFGVAVLSLVGAAFVGATAQAATVSGKVVYVESFNKGTTSIEWGTITIRPASGPWLAVWMKNSIPEETARRILEAAGRATSTHQFTFYSADQNPSWPYYFAATNLTLTRISRTTSVPAATVTWGGTVSSPVTVKGQMGRMDIYGSGTTWVYMGSQNYAISLPQDAGKHYSRLFTVSLGGMDADHDVEFKNLWYNGSNAGGTWDNTSINSYKARNQ